MHNLYTKLYLGILPILCLFPILSFGLRSVVTAVFILLGILVFTQKRKEKKVRYKLDLILFSLPFFFLILSLLYSENTKAGIDLLQKMLTFLLVPVVILSNKQLVTKQLIKRGVLVFVAAVFILVVYQIGNVIINYASLFANITAQELQANGFDNLTELSQDKINQIKVRRFRNHVIDLTRTHTTYQGLWIVFCLFYLGKKIRKLKKRAYKFLSSLVFLTLTAWLVMITPKMPIVGGFLSLFFVFVLFFKGSKKSRYIFLSVTAFTIVLLFATKNPIKIRFQEYYTTGFSILKNENNVSNYNSTNVRNGIYFCDFTILKQNILFGVGVGDVQDKLNYCYTDILASKIYTWRTYNSHNQFLFFAISSGILGFLSFLTLLFVIFKKSIQQKKPLLFFTISLVSFVFCTENILERSDGVLFFSLFITLFYVVNNQQKQVN